MLKPLKNILETDFEKELLEEALKNLNYKKSKIRCCNFAYTLRSLLDCIFENRISTNENVKNAPWYKKESVNINITRRQRYKYFIQGNADDYFINEIIKFNDIDKITENFNKTAHHLSKYTHISEKTFNLSEDEVDIFIKEIDESVTSFISNLFDIKTRLLDKLNIWLFDIINDAFMSDTIQEIDELCTHYLIDSINIDDIKFTDKNGEKFLDIYKPFDIEVTGQIEVEHQFGSDGDYKRGDGLRYNASYPYNIKLKINIPSIKELIDDDEEYDNLKNYTQKEKNELNSYFIEEFYRNIQIIDYKIDTSKHFE